MISKITKPFICLALLVALSWPGITAAQTTPLHDAAIASDETRIIALIEAGADVNARDEWAMTPLNIVTAAAAWPDQPKAIIALIDAGADVNASGGDGYTPLHWAKHSDVVKALLKAGADIEARNEWGNTPLHEATTSGAVKALLVGGAGIEVRDNNGSTPLHWVAYRATLKEDLKAMETLEALLDAGANVNAFNDFGYTPLHSAVLGATIAADIAKMLIEPIDQPRTIDVLIAAGAKPNIKTSAGQPALDLISKNNPLYKSPLWWKLHDLKYADQ